MRFALASLGLMMTLLLPVANASHGGPPFDPYGDLLTGVAWVVNDGPAWAMDVAQDGCTNVEGATVAWTGQDLLPLADACWGVEQVAVLALAYAEHTLEQIPAV